MTNPRFEPKMITPFDLAQKLGMTDPPATIEAVIDRARQMLSGERESRIAAEIELDAWREAARLTDEYTMHYVKPYPTPPFEGYISWLPGWSLYDVAHPEEGT